jgi:hypothetical protein
LQTEVEESAGPPGISRAEAVDRLRAAWRQSDDLATLSHHLRTLLEPEADDDGLCPKHNRLSESVWVTS